MPPTNPSLTGLDYRKCKVHELRNFVKSRGGTRGRSSRKTELIKRLRELDKQWAFRLMDLPAEMRNMVYRNLILFSQDGTGPLNVHILRADRLIHQEASAMLYAENTIKISICDDPSPEAHRPRNRADLPRPTHSYMCTKLNNTVLPRSTPNTHRGRLAIEYTRLPNAILHKIQHLRLEIGPHHSNFEHDVEVNRRLLALASVLGTSTELQNVDVHFLGANQGRYVQEALYPRTKLQARDPHATHQRTVTLHSFASVVQQRHQRRMTDGTPRPVDAFGALETLYQQLKDIEKVMKKWCPGVEHICEVILLAIEPLYRGINLHGVITYENYKTFCGKVVACKSAIERLEQYWWSVIRGEMVEVMRRAQREIDRTTDAAAGVWFGGQIRQLHKWKFRLAK